MSTSKPSRVGHVRDRWREWRRARNQRWVEKQAAKMRPNDPYSGFDGSHTRSEGGGPGM